MPDDATAANGGRFIAENGQRALDSYQPDWASPDPNTGIGALLDKLAKDARAAVQVGVAPTPPSHSPLYAKLHPPVAPAAPALEDSSPSRSVGHGTIRLRRSD